MSVIQEQIENVLRSNNNAQSTLLDILKDIKPDITDLTIKTPLHGDLDLSVLSALERLTSVVFGEGEITAIRNIPQRISKFVCAKNLLNDLNDLPGALLYLDCGHNYLTTLDLSKVGHISEVHCNDNKIVEFALLPTSLVALYCDNNNLKQLNLKGLKNLETLHISNNPLVIVSNLPETIHEFVSENNPIEMIMDEDTDTDGESKREGKINYMDALNEYFKLKAEYEEKTREKKRKEYAKGNGKKDKMRRSQAVKPKCVGCHRPVGSIFSTDTNGYTAICGDKNSPCPLNIKLIRGNFELHEKMLMDFKTSIDDVKDRIIKLKLFTLFGHVSEATSSKQFKKELDEYNTFSKVYKEEMQKYTELYNNAHKADLIRAKNDVIHKLNLTIRGLMSEYEKTGNTELLKTSAHIYKHDLIPEIDNLRRLRYEVVEMNNDESESVMFQAEVALSKNEYIYGEYPSVDKYTVT